MADIRWGAKRKCAACEASFYDMQKTSIACPKCGAAYRHVVLLKADGRPPRKNRGRPSAPLVQAVRDSSEAAADDPLPAAEDAEGGDDADDADKDTETVEENEDDVALEPGEVAR